MGIRNWIGGRVPDLADVALFVNCSREETFAGRSGGEHNMGQFSSKLRLTLVKWLDDSFAGIWVTETARREKKRNLPPDSPAGDRPRADTRPGLPEANFMVV